MIGYAGTKGKTTAATLKAILDHTTANKTAALLSTMNTTLDGKTYFKSHLTTAGIFGFVSYDGEAVRMG